MPASFAASRSKTSMKTRPIDLALRLGLLDAGERRVEVDRGVGGDDRDARALR